MTVKEWADFHSTCLIYKCQNNLAPQYCMWYPGKIKVLNWIELKSMHYLALYVDENLILELHVKSLTKVLSYKLYNFNKACKFINSTLLNMIYTRSIQTCLDYTCSVWGNCSEWSKFFLLRLQRPADRIV